MAARTNPKEAAGMLRETLDRAHERAGHFLDVLLDRLLDVDLTEDESSGLLQAFAEIMDDVERKTSWGSKEGRNDVWEKTRFLFRKYHPSNFNKVLQNGSSINWLAYIVRDQGFALGRPKGHRANPENAWLDLEEFDEAVETIVGRFESIGMQNISKLPSPLDAMFCWVQLGDATDVRDRFRTATKTHSQFLGMLEAMRSWASSSNIGVHHPLYAEIVKYFADPAETYSRLSSLASSGKLKHRAAAKALLQDWEPLEKS
jgi:hypothetical protein